MRAARFVAIAGLMLLALGGRGLHAQRDTLARVSGSVYDSLARRPLAGTRIEMARIVSGNVERPLATTTAANGTFEFHDVPRGRYLVVFRDAALDTLGLESVDTFVDIDRSDVDIRLGTPSATTLRQRVCAETPTSSRDRTGVLLGHLFDADGGAAIRGGTVDVFFTIPRMEGGGLSLDERLVTATTNSSGWFAVCSLPTVSSLTLRGKRGADTTGAIEATIPAGGVRHLSIYVPRAQARASGTLTGVVRDNRRQPIANGQVTHRGTFRTTTTDSSGRFSLDSIPEGSQSFEFRAIGRSPGDTTLRIQRDRTTNIEIALTQVTTLPTVVAKSSGRLTGLAAFEYNKRSAAGGYFIKPHRLEGYPQMQSARQLIQGLPGVPSNMMQMYKGVPDSYWDRVVIFINGRATNFQIRELDAAVNPETILALEFYPDGRGVPAAYRAQIMGSPVVLSVWTDDSLLKRR